MRKIIWIISISLFLGGILLSWQTFTHLLPTPTSLSVTDASMRKVQLLDRQQRPLTVTYQNRWNIYDYVPLHEIPESLQTIFVLSEDKRFFEHHGADWQARLHASWLNIKSGRVLRGASTITEQVGRIINPRPRTFWSRWLEGFEAARLENRFSKADILEFYLNQVPYANQRRGVAQAARYYFDRSISTLNLREMLALAILVRSPSRLDLHRGTKAIERSLRRLAKRLLEQGYITQEDYEVVLTEPLQLRQPALTVKATHFAHYVYAVQPEQILQEQGGLQTTLDAELQVKIQKILDERITSLRTKQVHNGAMLVVDHHNNEVLAWVNAGLLTDVPSSRVDAVTTPRQPGSTLKPFLYALALEKGWTAATFIQDTPLAEPVGTGLHTFHNYSRYYYGPLRLRDALGNSLNIPAIRTIRFVGAETFLQRLHRLGMYSLTNHPDYYGDGLALGNGAVTLFELVQAYSVLANQGIFQPLHVLRNTSPTQGEIVFSPEVSTLITNILSDSDARRLEFGRGALLRFPVQTAVKTGTSTDYRDAWSIGYNHRYTVGVWLGNLNQQPMLQVSGATGAALLLRTVFAELNRYEETQPLPLSPRLVKVNICRHNGQRAMANCPNREEWFVAGTEPPLEPSTSPVQEVAEKLYLKQPSAGLQLAMDPRIPDPQEAFALMLTETSPSAWLIEWLINDRVIGITSGDTKQFLWTLERGTHLAQAKIWQQDDHSPLTTPAVMFTVK